MGFPRAWDTQHKILLQTVMGITNTITSIWRHISLGPLIGHNHYRPRITAWHAIGPKCIFPPCFYDAFCLSRQLKIYRLRFRAFGGRILNPTKSILNQPHGL